MKILITGSNGLLGQKLLHKLRVDDAIELIATSKGENRVSEKSNYTYFELDITSTLFRPVISIFANQLKGG